MVGAMSRGRNRPGLIGSARARRDRHRSTSSLPWSVRLFAAAPAPARCLGGAADGRRLRSPPASTARSSACRSWTTFVEIDLLQITMIAFTPAATVYALRGAERDLADLRPVLRPEAGATGAGLERVFFLGRRWLVAQRRGRDRDRARPAVLAGELAERKASPSSIRSSCGPRCAAACSAG